MIYLPTQGAGGQPGDRAEGPGGGVLLPAGPDRWTRGHDSRPHRLPERLLHQGHGIPGKGPKTCKQTHLVGCEVCLKVFGKFHACIGEPMLAREAN